jgi:hypothetical protein
MFSLVHCFMEAGNKKQGKGMMMICAAVLWNLWRCRNSILYDNGIGSVETLVEKIKVSSWNWWMSRATEANCLLYEWYVEPRLCLLR